MSKESEERMDWKDKIVGDGAGLDWTKIVVGGVAKLAAIFGLGAAAVLFALWALVHPSAPDAILGAASAAGDIAGVYLGLPAELIWVGAMVAGAAIVFVRKRRWLAWGTLFALMAFYGAFGDIPEEMVNESEDGELSQTFTITAMLMAGLAWTVAWGARAVGRVAWAWLSASWTSAVESDTDESRREFLRKAAGR